MTRLNHGSSFVDGPKPAGRTSRVEELAIAVDSVIAAEAKVWVAIAAA
jgi:hypothetical protein